MHMYIWLKLQRGHIWLIDVSKGKFDSLCQFARFIAEQSFLDSSVLLHMCIKTRKEFGVCTFKCTIKRKNDLET